MAEIGAEGVELGYDSISAREVGLGRVIGILNLGENCQV